MLIPLFALLLTAEEATAQAGRTGTIDYQVPPDPISGALNSPGAPLVLLSPNRDRIALMQRTAQPSIAELAEPELRLAGLVINPRNNGPSRSASYSAIALRDLPGGMEHEVKLPAPTRVINVSWSPDGRHLALLLLKEETVELWTIEAATARASRLTGHVNAAFPAPYEWLPDSMGLLVRLVPERRAPVPDRDAVPQGPVIRESSGQAAPRQTIQNLLSDSHDEKLFEHYATSRLAIARLDGSPPRRLGHAGLIADAEVSPDGELILQRRIKRPFSYALPASAFPQEVIVTDIRGQQLSTIVDRQTPLASLSAVPAGPRAVRWREDAPSTLFWAEAVDEEAERDRLFLLEAPFRTAPKLIAEVDMRFQDVFWARPDFSLVVGLSPDKDAEHRMVIDPSGRSKPRLLQVRQFRGGGEAGSVLESSEDKLYLTSDGEGALVELPDGIGRLDLRSGSVAPLWSEQSREELFGPLDRDSRQLLTWRQSPTSPPNLFLVSRDNGAASRITQFPDPAPAYAGMQSRWVQYRRADGRELGGALYLPAGYDAQRDGPLPALIWAYPGSVGAGRTVQPSAAIDRFVRPTGFDDLPLLLTGRGYAVFKADMPVFGSEQSPANDTHVPQIVDNARAAIAALVNMGVAVPGNVAVGGHSYGAAMVANLLAHSDLFRTGIALSGAYNRTLTPFGFQASERRSFWEAPQSYLMMSPFIHADKIDEPILLVHGAADSNSGTHPMQSEAFYAALEGLGKEARFVLLPHEEHNYRAQESQMHVMWEIDRWLSAHLSGAEDGDEVQPIGCLRDTQVH